MSTTPRSKHSDVRYIDYIHIIVLPCRRAYQYLCHFNTFIQFMLISPGIRARDVSFIEALGFAFIHTS
jgi:hypothetical protein